LSLQTPRLASSQPELSQFEALYIQCCRYYPVCILILRPPRSAGGHLSRSDSTPGMPFAGPEMAFPARFAARGTLSTIRREIVRPAASQSPPTTFQSLPPRLNDLGRIVAHRSISLSSWRPAGFGGPKDIRTRREYPCCQRLHRSFGPQKGAGLRMTRRANEIRVIPRAQMR
jgi:hypothetical protein